MNHICNRLHADARAVYDVFNLGADPRGQKSQAQGLNVMNFVGDAVDNLDDMAAVQVKIDALASRHIGYGARKSHFVVSKCTYT